VEDIQNAAVFTISLVRNGDVPHRVCADAANRTDAIRFGL
jgi:hypothetical protein